MEVDRPGNELARFIEGLPHRENARQIGNARPVACRASPDENAVLHFSPACLRMLFQISGGMSLDGLPLIVTFPGFTGCLNCRWEPS